MDQDLLTDEEIVEVAYAFLTGMGRPCSEEEITEAIRWAREAKISAALLKLICGRKMTMRKRDDGEWEFQAVGGG